VVQGRPARWSPISGIVFAVLYVIAGVLFMSAPAPSASNDAILSYYADGGGQRKFAIAFLLTTVAAPFFRRHLRGGRLRRNGPPSVRTGRRQQRPRPVQPRSGHRTPVDQRRLHAQSRARSTACRPARPRRVAGLPPQRALASVGRLGRSRRDPRLLRGISSSAQRSCSHGSCSSPSTSFGDHHRRVRAPSRSRG